MLQENRLKIIMVGAIIIFLLLVVGFYFYQHNESVDDISLEEYELSTKEEVEQTKSQVEVVEEVMYKVDLKGAVVNPGVYEVNSGSRVIDAIHLAGGLNSNADTSDINLSKFITDEMVIIVSTKEEILANKNSGSSEKQIHIDNQASINSASVITSSIINSNANQISGQENNNGLININTATREELQTLSGIGESKATAIIEYRSLNGSFTTIEDIKNVKGIGDSVFEKIKNNLTV